MTKPLSVVGITSGGRPLEGDGAAEVGLVVCKSVFEDGYPKLGSVGKPLWRDGNLVVFTLVPDTYPTLTLAVGLYVFSSALRQYWSNTLTT